MKNCCGIIISFYEVFEQMNGRSHQSNRNLVRYLDRSVMHISSIISGSGIVFYGSFGPLQGKELLCNYYHLLGSL